VYNRGWKISESWKNALKTRIRDKSAHQSRAANEVVLGIIITKMQWCWENERGPREKHEEDHSWH